RSATRTCPHRCCRRSSPTMRRPCRAASTAPGGWTDAMALRLVQLTAPDGRRCIAADLGHGARCVDGIGTVYELARAALAERSTLEDCARRHVSPEAVDLERAEREGRLLPPIDHPNPAHLLLSGTGLTHLGSAETRDRMHREAAGEELTDSMR